MTTHADLIAMVAEMRRLQKEYFRTRSTQVLSLSKAAERRVDLALAEARDGQLTMFGEVGGG